ncbi:hypothetical protein ACG04R_24930 [Roseateles sp. BYS78W]|uniref:CPBP family intramembrane metalloprotease n=1 Tax=Pelomonas candidula TaxID=3299025 RepID=A0ABW7HJ78_9BURK
MNWPALLARRPWTAAFGLGLGLSLCTAPASLGTALLANALLPDGWFGESAAGNMGELSSLGFLLLGVFLFPAWETLLGQCLPIEPLRRLRAPALACVMASATLFGGAHWVNGGLGHGLTTFVAGSLFALAYWLCRPAGFRFAAVAAYSTHAAHNFLVWFVLGPLLGG